MFALLSFFIAKYELIFAVVAFLSFCDEQVFRRLPALLTTFQRRAVPCRPSLLNETTENIADLSLCSHPWELTEYTFESQFLSDT